MLWDHLFIFDAMNTNPFCLASILQLGTVKLFESTNFMKRVNFIYRELSFSELIFVNKSFICSEVYRPKLFSQ